jgi:hypothetical protein
MNVRIVWKFTEVYIYNLCSFLLYFSKKGLQVKSTSQFLSLTKYSPELLRMKEPLVCPQVEAITSQNHGQIRAYAQEWLVRKEEISGPYRGPKAGRNCETPLEWLVQCLRGHFHPSKKRLFLGDWLCLCEYSCGIALHFKRSTASCFSKSVNAEVSLERPVLDLVHPTAWSSACRLFSLLVLGCAYLMSGGQGKDSKITHNRAWTHVPWRILGTPEPQGTQPGR